MVEIIALLVAVLALFVAIDTRQKLAGELAAQRESIAVRDAKIRRRDEELTEQHM